MLFRRIMVAAMFSGCLLSTASAQSQAESSARLFVELNSAEAIRLTADWYAAWTNGADMTRFTLEQLHAYQERKESAR